MTPIAHIVSPFTQKFGIPRQAGIVETAATVIFTPPFRIAEAVRGLEDFDYIWLLWQFSASPQDQWSPTVRPPRLGGNQRMGVFATRSPFRPNGIGLSSVRLTKVEYHPTSGPVLHILGADLLDGTPILDIKPYLPYTDAHTQARAGFAPSPADRLLSVDDPEGFLVPLPHTTQSQLADILAHDPRPQYHNDPDRIYHLVFGNNEIHFHVVGNHAIITGIDSANNPF